MASDANRARYALVYSDYIFEYFQAIYDRLLSMHNDVQAFITQYPIPYPLVEFSREYVNYSRVNEASLLYVWNNRDSISIVEWDACIDIYKDIPKANSGGRKTHDGATYTYYSDATYQLALDLGRWMAQAGVKAPTLIIRDKPSLKVVSNLSIIHTGRFILGQSIQKSS